MPTLAELQRGFADAMFGPSARDFAAFLEDGRGTAEMALGVYRSSVLGNYRKALGAVYPVVERLVGQPFFEQAAAVFARRTPSLHGDLNRYGAGFAEFLAHFPGADRLAYLPDVARLEWAIECVFQAADPLALAPEKLAELLSAGDSRLSFVLAPHCRLLHSPWPVDRLWALNQPDVPWDDDFSIDSGEVHLLVRRHDYAVEIEPLAAGEYELLAGLDSGRPLAELLPPDEGAPAANLGAFLGQRLALADLRIA